jgi:riboflavin kinase / FMN adenylyltransferase
LMATLTPTRVALGNFDGVHRGHQHVIDRIFDGDRHVDGSLSSGSEAFSQQDEGNARSPSAPMPTSYLSADMTHRSVRAVQAARRHRRSRPATVWNGDTNQVNRVYTTVLTFNPHPQAFFSGQSRSLLSPIAEKVDALRALGVDQLVLLPFNQQIASLSPEDFVQRILIEGLQAEAVSVGGNFRFGHRRSGTSADLQRLCQARQVEAHIVELHHIGDDRVSSSTVRTALEVGDLDRANRLLGRPYRVAGTVEQGQQLGRTIGFPTANIHLPPDKFLPRWGVYAGRVWLTDGETPIAGVLNIGCRPTVNGTRPTVEVHLMDWDGNLYGRCLSIELLHFLRPEEKFASLDALKAQIQRDRDRAVALLAASP